MNVIHHFVQNAVFVSITPTFLFFLFSCKVIIASEKKVIFAEQNLYQNFQVLCEYKKSHLLDSRFIYCQ